MDPVTSSTLAAAFQDVDLVDPDGGGPLWVHAELRIGGGYRAGVKVPVRVPALEADDPGVVEAAVDDAVREVLEDLDSNVDRMVADWIRDTGPVLAASRR